MNEDFNIKCRYIGAPVKTRARSIIKGKLDYKHKQWPHTSNILDIVRCSIEFDDIENYLKGYNQFVAKYYLHDRWTIGRNAKTKKEQQPSL